jgi:hypothetical protein
MSEKEQVDAIKMLIKLYDDRKIVEAHELLTMIEIAIKEKWSVKTTSKKE